MFCRGECQSFAVRFRLLVLVLLAVAGRVFAFSGEGHQIIATIAAEKLKGTRAEREIAALLGDKSLAEVSTWADRLKRKAFDEESAAFRERNRGQDRYHYTNVPFQAAAYREGSKGTSPTDVVHMIARCVRVLRGQEPEGQLTRKEALMLLVHLVGDLHQPLHVGCGYVTGDGLRFEDPASESRVGVLNSGPRRQPADLPALGERAFVAGRLRGAERDAQSRLSAGAGANTRARSSRAPWPGSHVLKEIPPRGVKRGRRTRWRKPR